MTFYAVILDTSQKSCAFRDKMSKNVGCVRKQSYLCIVKRIKKVSQGVGLR